MSEHERPLQGGHTPPPPGARDPWGKDPSEMPTAKLKALTAELPECDALRHFVTAYCRTFERTHAKVNHDMFVTVQIGEWIASVPYGEIVALRQRLDIL